MTDFKTSSQKTGLEIAIIGMACRFPGANNIDEFWRNLREGVESITFFSDEELKSRGVNSALLSNPNYVKIGLVLESADLFDASFFDINSREAETLDPQHRIFLECAWEALENAGYDSEKYNGSIGVYAGASRNHYLSSLQSNHDLMELVGDYQANLGTNLAYLTTLVSYKMNLKGPSISVQTACSTSLVAVHLACQSLLSGECEIALAGGVAINVSQKEGYLYQPGLIFSPDGRCRTFDAKAQGTILGNGAGIVVLKRLKDALEDGDCIHALIKGTAVGNDGSLRVGFTAPSVDGQARVIKAAHTMAEIEADSISYIEAHGTATELGDPIEIAGLTKAFNASTHKKVFCAIGSVKTNLGHMSAAAGIGGLIKTVLALKNKMLPPSLHFEKPNPNIDFENSPFYVNTKLSQWEPGETPRRAGVSSFGMGGTNAHVVVEEAPSSEASGPSRPWQLLLLSAKTKTALEKATTNLKEHLKRNSEINLADVAFTLNSGRRDFKHRRMLLCQDREDVLNSLEILEQKKVFTSIQEHKNPPIIFMFPGQGSQYINMGLELYLTEPTYREQIDHCAHILKHILKVDLRELLYPTDNLAEKATKQLNNTKITQPALFVVEYALARLLMDWGIWPQAMVGHSLGEYVAACLAGVFSLEDALSLIATRGRLIQELPGGCMLAVFLSEKKILPFLGKGLSLAAINAPSLCTVSGEKGVVEDLERQLSKKNIDCRRLHVCHAFHSQMMEPILKPFYEEIIKIKLNTPQLPYISNLTGKWVTNEQVRDPRYWINHLRQTVQFSKGLKEVLRQSDQILIEIGPGRTLSSLVKQHQDNYKGQVILSSLRHSYDTQLDVKFLLNTLGKLWLAGVEMNWTRFYAYEKRQHLPLPPYPFEHKRYWVEPLRNLVNVGTQRTFLEKKPAIDHLELELLQEEENLQKKGSKKSTLLYSRPHLQCVYLAPESDSHRVMAHIWQELLGIEHVGITDNFFELGGSSLIAVRLLAQIERLFGKKLPMSTIFRAPTIKQLSNVLDQKETSVPLSSLVVLQEGSSKTPFFCIPGMLGNVFMDLNHLVRHLGTDQPVYGLQDGIGLPSKIEALANYFIREIRSVKPNGPYFIGGICFGGALAFEIAKQFQNEGQDVGLLALVEPASASFSKLHGYTRQIVGILGRFAQRFGPHSRYVLQLSLDEKKAYLRLRMKLIANHFALARYVPSSYPGRIHLFLTHESLSSSRNPRLAWRELANDGAEIHEIPGTHNTITGFDVTPIEEAHMRVLAEKLRACIDNALSNEHMP